MRRLASFCSNKYCRLLGIAFLLVLIAILYYGLRSYFTVDTVQEHGAYFDKFIEQHYVGALLLYISIYSLVIAASLPLVAPLAMTGGYLFGAFAGLVSADIATTFGATLSFVFLRHFLSYDSIAIYRKKFTRLETNIKKNGIRYLLMLEFVSIVPFFVVNVVGILAHVSVFTLAWTAAVGSIPFLFVYALAGAQLRSVGSVGDLFSPYVIGALILIFVMLICTSLWHKKWSNKL